jgi:hypothetical protein
MGWVWHVARKEEPINVNNIGWESLKKRDALRNSDTDGNKILTVVLG